MHDRKDGLREGIARGMSQACVYCYEAQKTMLQVYGTVPKMPPVQFIQVMSRGLVESVITSGVVFGSYFSVYNHMGMANPFAGPIATLATSIIKTPISNSMRILQAGLAPNLVQATTKIIKAKSVGGLYSGYRTSIVEDMIEIDLRVRTYKILRETLATHTNVSPSLALGIGALSGMVTAWITTPFDTIRAHMAVDATSQTKNIGPIAQATKLIKKGGVRQLYNGATIRAVSNGVKSALFYMFFEMLQ